MQLLSSDRSTIAQAATVTLVTTAALALFAAVAAYWTWQWLGPPPVARLQAQAPVAGPASAAAALFGKLAAPAGAGVSSGIEIQLLGSVAATPGRTGYALLRSAPRQTLTVREGDEILPGIRLASVAADHVEVERGGVREILAWPVKPAAANPVATGNKR